jgi:hypothetical protein
LGDDTIEVPPVVGGVRSAQERDLPPIVGAEMNLDANEYGTLNLPAPAPFRGRGALTPTRVVIAVLVLEVVRDRRR